MYVRKKHLFFLISLGILLSLLVNESIYQQPEYNVDVVHADFELITPEGISLGQASSTINIKYLPDQPYTTIGKFYVTVITRVSKSYIRTSIFSKDVEYKISFWLESELLEEYRSNYLGALNTTENFIMYTTMSFPFWSQPIKELQSTYGRVSIDFKGVYLYLINNETLAEGATRINIFIMPPIIKISTFSSIIIIVSLWLINNIQTNKLRIVKKEIKKG